MSVSGLRAAPPQLAQAAVEASPVGLLTVALGAAGATPDPWQTNVLSSRAGRLVVVAGRQLGKGSVAAAKALHLAAFMPDQLVLVVSASERQAKIVLGRMRGMLPYLGPAAEGVEDTQTVVRLGNGSQVVVLPSTSTALRGWTAALLLLDEAAYISRPAWEAVVPTVAATDGQIIALTSAGAPAGWLYEVWTDTTTFPEWERHAIRAVDVPRISERFLATERRRLPKAVFDREYMCVFTGSEGAVFDPDAVAAAFARDEAAAQLPAVEPVERPFDFSDLDLTAVLLGEEEG